MVTSDRLSAFDVVLDEPILHKGRVLTAISAFWFEALGDVVGSHLVSTDLPTCPPAWPRPTRTSPAGSCCAARPRCSRSSASCGATCPAPRGRSTAPAAPCTARRCPPGCRRATSCPSRCSRPSTKSDVHDENISFDAGRRPRGRGAGDEGAGHRRSSSTRRGAALARERGIIIADTKFELGLVDGELVLCDEVHDAGLQPLLAGRRVEARRHAAELRQAARAGLPRDARLGQEPAAAAAAGTRWSRRRAAATSRPTSGSPAGPSRPGPACPDRRGPSRKGRGRRRTLWCALRSVALRRAAARVSGGRSQ